MFQLPTPTAATLASIAPRTEHHGDDLVVAVSLKLRITSGNTLLDQLSPTLRHALYMAADGQEQLPGVEPSTPLLRSTDIETLHVKGKFEGWTLRVDHGVDEDDPITLSGYKVDNFRVEAMQGGTIKLDFRVGSNDVSAEEIGLLCGKLGSEISITLEAPAKPAEPIDGTVGHPGAATADEGQGSLLDPDAATEAFVAAHAD